MASRKLLMRTAASAAVLAAVYAAAGYLAVPAAVQWAMDEYLPGVLGDAQVQTGAVRFSPWSWTLEIEDLQAVSRTKPDELSVRLGRLTADVSCETVFRGAPVLSELSVQGLKVNLSDALFAKKTAAAPASAPAAQTAAETSAGGLPAFAVRNLSVTDTDLVLASSRSGETTKIEGLTLRLPVLSTMGSGGSLDPVTPELSLRINGTPVAASGSAAQDKGSLKLRIDALDAARIARSLPVDLPWNAKSGLLTLHGTVDFSFADDDAPAVVTSGELYLQSLDVRTAEGKPFAELPAAGLAWQQVQLQHGLEVANGGVTLTAEKLRVRDEKGRSLAGFGKASVAVSGVTWNGKDAGAAGLTASVEELDAGAALAVMGDASVKKAALSVAETSWKDGVLSLTKPSVEVTGARMDKGRTRILSAASAAFRAGTLTAPVTGEVAFADAQATLSKIDLRPEGRRLLSLTSLDSRWKAFDLAGRTVSLESAKVVSPDVWVRIEPSEEKAAEGKKGAPEQSKTDSAPAWKFAVGEASVTGGRVRLIDETTDKTAQLTVSKVTASVKGIDSQKGKGEWSAGFAVGSGTVSASGTAQFAPSIDVSGKAQIAALPLSAANPWLARLSSTRIAKGTGEMSGSFRFAGREPDLTWKGELGVRNLDVRALGGALSVAGCGEAKATGIELRSIRPIDLSVAQLHVKDPSQPALDGVKQVTNVIGFIGSLTGNRSIERTTKKMQVNDITLTNLSYGPDGFRMGDQNSNGGLADVILNSMNAFLTKK